MLNSSPFYAYSITMYIRLLVSNVCRSWAILGCLTLLRIRNYREILILSRVSTISFLLSILMETF